jgi:MoxR-like ATPase
LSEPRFVETTTVDAVVDVLLAANVRRVGIDGIDGCGKTTLAKFVAARLQLPWFSLDHYLDRNRGGFLGFIDYPRLHADVSKERASVIEGVCLLQALQRAELEIDALVYIKRCHMGLWADERELEVDGLLENFLKGERELAAMLEGEPITNLGLAEEIIRYHYEARPHKNAQVVYFREEP